MPRKRGSVSEQRDEGLSVRLGLTLACVCALLVAPGVHAQKAKPLTKEQVWVRSAFAQCVRMRESHNGADPNAQGNLYGVESMNAPGYPGGVYSWAREKRPSRGSGLDRVPTLPPRRTLTLVSIRWLLTTPVTVDFRLCEGAVKQVRCRRGWHDVNVWTWEMKPLPKFYPGRLVFTCSGCSEDISGRIRT